MLSLSGLAVRVEYHLSASRLDSSLLYYTEARRHFPDTYSEIINLRLAPFVKLLLANQFPRTTVTTRLSGAQVFQYGPFRNRASAERFEQEVLDLFQVRRCQEDLEVSPDHPGCIYGEMMKCLRPCQQVVGPEEYRSEVDRLVHFFQTAGHSLLDPLAAARDRLSEELNFEEAQRQQLRYKRVEQVLKLRDDLVDDIDRLCGVSIAPGIEAGCVQLLFLLRGVWLPPVEFRVAATGKDMIPLDRRLREMVDTLPSPKVTVRERGEHLALLARWYYSSWRDAEFIQFPALEELPYRRLVRAISKSAAAVQTTLFES
jgi:excinuclease UvrABC nuclease subunit